MQNLTRQEQTREHNRLTLNNERTIEDHIRKVQNFAPEYLIPYNDPDVLASFQAVIDAGGYYRMLGNRYTDMICAAIDAGQLQRARRSWSGRAMSALNLAS